MTDKAVSGSSCREYGWTVMHSVIETGGDLGRCINDDYAATKNYHYETLNFILKTLTDSLRLYI